MTTPRFIQIHSLVSYPAVLLNRDDAGQAKRVSYGGAVRTRVSSQCLKRHWRKADDDWSLAATGLDLSARSREIFEYEIEPKLRAAVPEVSDETVAAIGAAISKLIYGKKFETVRSRQAMLLGYPEIRFLTDEAIALARAGTTPEAITKVAVERFESKDAKVNFTAMKEAAGALASGLEAALFGRMVTSDPSANTDAAIHVAHAFTVHAQEAETDYFTVVDDLKERDPEEDSGSAGIFDTELTSGVFYEYVVVDVPLLVSNLTGCDARARDAWKEADRTLPAKVLEHLVHLIATISPGAKKGSTAPYAAARTLLIEAGGAQPRSLASAFECPVTAAPGQSMGGRAEAALLATLAKFDAAYGKREARRLLSVDGTVPTDVADGPIGLDALAAWVRDAVVKAEV